MSQKSRTKIRRSSAQWQAIMSKYELSGLSQERFCQQEGLAFSTFAAWRQRLREENKPEQAFIELPAVSASPASDWALEIDLGHGITVRVCFSLKVRCAFICITSPQT